MVAVNSRSAPVVEDLAKRLRAAYGSVPDRVLESAGMHVLDAIGVGVAASRLGPISGLAGIASTACGGTSSVFGLATRTSTAVAALVNGSLVHSLEFDDTHGPSVVHGDRKSVV